MEYLTDLKAILHSKRANLYYLEKCRIMLKDGRVVFLTESKKEYNYWNIPIANTTVILLGIGTSITQGAVRMLASAGVMIGFTGAEGTPLLAGNEIEWLCPQSEYRPTEYIQGWMSFWFEEAKRLKAAKLLQCRRVEYLEKTWRNDTFLHENNFYIDDQEIVMVLDAYKQKIMKAADIGELLRTEAVMTKALYRYAAKKSETEGFVRDNDSIDTVNIFLNHGNYLAYGLAATTLWVLGIPHGFAVMHGKTRRGALVFDIADLIKDAIILPFAFICAKQRITEKSFRDQCVLNFTKHKALDYMFDTTKEIALLKNWETSE